MRAPTTKHDNGSGMADMKWDQQKVHGRDEKLRASQARANGYAEQVVRDLRDLMNDYEVDIYRIIIEVGRRYGMATAYEIMSATVAEKRLKWLDGKELRLPAEATDAGRGFDLLVQYFRPAEGELEVITRSDHRVIFKRKEFVTAISHACHVLDLDVVEVSNMVYAPATNRMFQRLGLKARHVIRAYRDGWYEECVELT